MFSKAFRIALAISVPTALLATAIQVLVICGKTPAVGSQSIRSQDQLSVEISRVDEEIANAIKESELYAGGLIKTLIDLRVATLKQTRAMLAQRAAALNFNVTLVYTVNGIPFTLPDSLVIDLAALEVEISALKIQILKEQVEADRYTGGLVQAMHLSTIATSKQSLAMLEQKRLALTYGLPQFIGFASLSADQTATPAASPPTQTPSSTNDWEIVEVDSKITESNSTWWKFAWKLTLRNNGKSQLACRATIEFQDKDGFIVDDDSSPTLLVEARATETFTGYVLVTAEVAPNVALTKAKVRPIR